MVEHDPACYALFLRVAEDLVDEADRASRESALAQALSYFPAGSPPLEESSPGPPSRES